MGQTEDVARAISWQSATVERIVVQTRRVKSFYLQLPERMSFKAGHHVDIRLTAPDGYQAQRSYSIASAPEDDNEIELVVELIAAGEVSPFFHDVVECGDEIEMRGPIGGPFTWTAAQSGPLLLVGGGSGVVPLMSMLRHQANTAPNTPVFLLYSSRSFEDIIFMEELDRYARDNSARRVVHTLTRSQPSGWGGHSRRVDQDMLMQAIDEIGAPSQAYACGPTGFVEAVADCLVALHIPPANIHTERFGPSGT